MPLREETIPIRDLRITFRGYNLDRVHLEPDGVELPLVPVPDGTAVVVPKLEIHSTVVAELND